MNVSHQSSGSGVSNTYPSGVAISAGPSRGSPQRTRTSAASAVPGYVSPPSTPAIDGTHDAVGTAGADAQDCVSTAGPPVGVAPASPDRVRARLHRGHRDTALEHTPRLDEPVGEDLLRAPLGQAALVLPATAGAGEPHLADQCQLRVDHPGEPHCTDAASTSSTTPARARISSVPG